MIHNHNEGMSVNQQLPTASTERKSTDSMEQLLYHWVKFDISFQRIGDRSISFFGILNLELLGKNKQKIKIKQESSQILL